MAGHTEVCRALIKEHGPLLASELVQLLGDRAGVSPTNARQILFRLKRDGEIHSTAPVSFGRNQFIYFLPGQNLLNKLQEVIPDHRQALNRIYQALLDQNGFLLWSDFAKISAAVVNKNQAPGRKTAFELFEDLKHLGLVEDLRVFNHTHLVVAKESWVPKVGFDNSTASRRLKDDLLTRRLTEDLLAWLERLNIAGMNATHLHTDELDDAGFNGYWWDAYGFSYLWGLYNATKDDDTLNPPTQKKGSLILVESVLTRQFQHYDLAGFIARVNTQYGRLKNTRGNFRIIPICFIAGTDRETLSLARRRGIMVITLAEVFGTRIYEVLNDVRKLDPRHVDPEALARVLQTADEAGQDGKMGAMKGYLFNWLVSSLFEAHNWHAKIGVKYKYDGQVCECDVVASAPDVDFLVVCECKGYNNDRVVELGEDEEAPGSVKRFFERTIAMVKKATNVEHVLPVYITSGVFEPSAVEFLTKTQEKKGMKRLQEAAGRFPQRIFYDHHALLKLLGNKEVFTQHRQVLTEFYRARKKPSHSQGRPLGDGPKTED